jgi:ribosomal protein S18 acetylase RimI-like enzyme
LRAAEIIIRPWSAGDLDDLREITWRSWIFAYRAFIPESDLSTYFDIHYDAGSFSALLADPSTTGYVAEADGCLAGYARLFFEGKEKRLYLAALYLLPDYQGRGIGKRLTGAAERYAAERGITEIWVGVMVRNRRALRFYRKEGFQFVREEPFTMGKTTVGHLIGYKKLGPAARHPLAPPRVFAAFDGSPGGRGLPELCLDLLSEQKKSWMNLREGYEHLKAVREREVTCRQSTIRLQFNPGRISSSTAVLSAEAIRNRPCFLCLENLPEHQAGVFYRGEFLILCNPMPVFPFHYTVSHVDHRAQLIEPVIESFLRLMADLGPDWAVLYNGAKCGASAPDHLHLQVCPAGRMPLGVEIEKRGIWIPEGRRNGVTVCRAADLGREALILEGEDSASVMEVFRKLASSLQGALKIDGEPLLNMAGFSRGGLWRLVVFPRLKHRPDVFFKEGDDRVVVSPGVIDMSGVLITPLEKDFERLDGASVERIYREVSLDQETVDRVIAAMAR